MADDPKKTSGDLRTTTNPLDMKDVVTLLRRIQQLSVFAARINSLSTEHHDEYTADIFPKRTTDESTIIYKDIKIYQPNINLKHAEGQWVDVYVDDNQIGLILPPSIPQGTGRCRVLMIVDDNNPGTIDWSYFSFQS